MSRSVSLVIFPIFSTVLVLAIAILVSSFGVPILRKKRSAEQFSEVSLRKQPFATNPKMIGRKFIDGLPAVSIVDATNATDGSARFGTGEKYRGIQGPANGTSNGTANGSALIDSRAYFSATPVVDLQVMSKPEDIYPGFMTSTPRPVSFSSLHGKDKKDESANGTSTTQSEYRESLEKQKNMLDKQREAIEMQIEKIDKLNREITEVANKEELALTQTDVIPRSYRSIAAN
jgi:hypothetical protein